MSIRDSVKKIAFSVLFKIQSLLIGQGEKRKQLLIFIDLRQQLILFRRL